MDVRYLLNRLSDTDSGQRVFLDRIVRTKLGFQFTRALSLRTIVQYDSLTVDPEETTLETRRNVNFDVLLRWQASPWTALFVGYNDNRANIDPSLEWTPNGLLRTPGPLMRDGRQFFAKFSFLFSLN